jgi:hypothetical protein
MCKELFAYARLIDDKTPVRIHPKCHPKCHMDVFVDGPKQIVTLCCSKCDKPVAIIRVKREAGRPKNHAG